MDAQIDLRFPELNGGPVQGLNDAGVENFQGEIDAYLSRECGQNTGDAIRDGIPFATLEFQRKSLSPSAIPGLGSLGEAFESCLARWGDRAKERAFFTAAIAALRQPSISVLKISDYGTTGLTGDDTTEDGRWFALVKSQGVSNKSDIAGGSFGIGKSSPFAASQFRTVIYSTMTESGAVALQGVTRLATHADKNNRQTQGIGFIGDFHQETTSDEPVYKAVRTPERIPDAFRRTEPGTDIWIIGYSSGPSWQTDLTRSIVANFWPAIHRKGIVFRVGDSLIDHDSLPSHIDSFRGTEDFSAEKYFDAILREPAKKTLPTVGACELFLTTAGTDLPKKICMARLSGMRIYEYAPRACRVPFSGLFICNDPKGNRILRELEPPRHDTWDAKRGDGTSGKRALDEIKTWIRDEVKRLNPLLGKDSFNEGELAKYVPEVQPEDTSDVPNAADDAAQNESLERHTSEEGARPRPAHAIPVVPIKPISGDGDTSTGPRTKKGQPSVSPKRDPRKDSKDAAEDRAGPRSRIFRSGGNAYTVVLRSDEGYSGAIQVLSVGEDGSLENVQIMSVETAPGDDAPTVSKGGVLSSVVVTPGNSTRFNIAIATAERRSLITRPIE